MIAFSMINALLSTWTFTEISFSARPDMAYKAFAELDAEEDGKIFRLSLRHPAARDGEHGGAVQIEDPHIGIFDGLLKVGIGDRALRGDLFAALRLQLKAVLTEDKAVHRLFACKRLF